jgi:hydrophobe/amphiphile efflux-1 (HAE1) family protein
VIGSGSDLIGVFVKRPVAMLLVALGITVFGVAAWGLLPVASLPEVEYPVIDVEASFPGASADTMATAVAAPLERRFSSISGMQQMNSTSSVGTTTIRMRFALGRSIDAASADVQAAISNAAGDLPRDMPSPPSFYKENPADRPIVVMAFTSDVMSIAKVDHYTDTIIVRHIGDVAGVSRARLVDEQKFAVRINVNPVALAERGLSLEDARQAIERASINRPKGKIDGNGSSASIAVNDQLFDAASFGDIIIASRKGAEVKLSDVAAIEDGVENNETFGWYDGKPAIIIGVRKRLAANVVQTVDNIMLSLERLSASLPAAIDLHVVTERAENIRSSLHEIQWTLDVTIGLVILVTFLFLRNVAATMIPAVTIPLSMLTTLVVMYLLGYTLDNLSLMALVVATGFVVDDAIVVMENIFRHLEEGEAPEAAAIRGTRQVAFTILSITLSLVAVFIPVFFMGGIVGRLFREFSATVSVAILASAVLSLTLSPMMCRWMLRIDPRPAGSGRLDRWGSRVYDAIFGSYRTSVTWVLNHRGVALAAFIGVLWLTGWLYAGIPKGFFPSQDNGRMFAGAVAAPGTSFAETRALVEKMAPVLRSDPDVDSVTSYADGGNAGSFFINLKPRDQRSSDVYGVMARLRAAAKQVKGLQLFMKPEAEIVTGTETGRTEYLYTLTDSDRTELEKWAPVLEAALKRVSGLVDVSLNRDDDVPSKKITVSREMAARLGVDLQAIDDTLYDAFGDRRVTEIFGDTDQYYAILGLGETYHANPAILDLIYVAARDGRQIPLSTFAHFEVGLASPTITHRGQFSSEKISFNIEKGLSIGEAVERIHAVERTLGVPQGVELTFEGAAREFEESLASQPWLIGAAILVIYIVLGILYESLIHPLTILSSLPSAGAGALLALKLAGSSLDVMGMIGIILLLGIVKKNAIMMVDFAIKAEADGKSPEEAVITACMVRFRPIVMTSLAAIFGALPLALGGGAGAELRHPLGISIVGGLLVSQLLTLYSTPVIHLQLRYLTQRIARLRQGVRKTRETSVLIRLTRRISVGR